MKQRRAFTLVEVLVVVVLVGILATIAIVVYRRYMNTVKTAEAANNIAGIATAQQAVKGEKGVYLNVSGQLNNLYPAATPGTFKTEWGGACAACLQPWTKLPFKPLGPVQFGYATVASRSAMPDSIAPASGGGGGGFGGGGGGGGGRNQFGAGPGAASGSDEQSVPDPNNPGQFLPDATGPYFTIIAKGDTDGNGVYASALYYSETNNVVFDLAGE